MNIVQDGDAGKQGAVAAGRSMTALLHPSTLMLLAANSIPIYGVLHWGRDVFVLLMLYWLETAIIGGWTIARIAVAPPGSLGQMEVNGRTKDASSLAVAGFFVLHSGIFMTVHMVFLWTLFSGDWSKKIHGPVDFISKLMMATDLWIPLLVLLIVRGVGFLFHVLRPEFIQQLERSLGRRGSAQTAAPEELGSIIGGFYSRIVVMHLTILSSGFVAEALGTITPLILMVALKSFADVVLQLKFDFGQSLKTARAPATVSPP